MFINNTKESLINNTRVEIEPNLEKPKQTIDQITPDEYKRKKKFLQTSADSEFVYLGEHPIFVGFIKAYKEHRPITINPDIIWLLIVQGFSQHVLNNSENLRSKFVNFSDKKGLNIERLDLTPDSVTVDDWNEIFSQFTNEISKFTGQELIDVLTPSFSTTTPISVAVGQLSIMCSMKKYFSYTLTLAGCGIPYVNIEGTVDDWEKILYRINYLEQFDLSFWINELRPIINEIINSKKGIINHQFWLDMIHHKNIFGVYSSEIIDGWFIKFFPYSNKGKKNSLQSLTYSPSDLPKEMQDVPFVLKIAFTNISFDMKFKGGFIGLKQDPKTFCLKPEIGWYIKKDDKSDDEKDDFDYNRTEFIRTENDESIDMSIMQHFIQNMTL